jgi:hypothetical protein
MISMPFLEEEEEKESVKHTQKRGKWLTQSIRHCPFLGTRDSAEPSPFSRFPLMRCSETNTTNNRKRKRKDEDLTPFFILLASD